MRTAPDGNVYVIDWYDKQACHVGGRVDAWDRSNGRIYKVSYRGINDGHGIWGVWEIRLLGGLYLDRGGFHIWPEGSDVSEESARTEEAVLQIMRQEFGNRMGPALSFSALFCRPPA